jgi:tetratricopeptide (TPR) repeat protein
MDQFSYFNQQFNIQPSYPLLADPTDSVASLYALTANLTTIIIDKSGVVRYVGGFAPWTTIADEIEALRGNLRDVDLSSMESVVKALKSPESYIRWKAVKTLGDMEDQSVLTNLIAALKDESASVREMAVQALGDVGNKEAVDPLITAFDDKSDLVRAEIVKALVKLKDERAITPLVKSLADANLRTDAANALAEINKPELVSKALEDNNISLRTTQPYEVGEPYASLGTAYLQRKMYDAAVPLFSKAIEVSTDSYRKRDYTGNLANCYIEMGEVEKAVTEYLKTIKNASIDRVTMWNTGADGIAEGFDEREWAIQNFVQSFQQRNKLDDLTKILEAKVVESPQDAIIYEVLGYVYDTQGISQKAIPMYEKAVELNPNYIKDYIRLISAYNRAGMTDKAVTMAKEISKKPSGDASVQSSIAKVYLECKMYDEAISAYKKAKLMSQGDWDRKGYMFGLASSYVGAGKYAEAISEYEDIIKISGGDTYYQDIAERLLWDAYARGNMYDKVIEKYKKMVEANPEDAKAHEYLAKVYEKKSDDVSAIAAYENLTKLQPDNAQWYRTIGDLYQKPTITGLSADSVLELDGNKSYLESANSDALNNLNYQITIEAWIYPTAFNNDWMSIVYKGDEFVPDFSNRSYTLWLGRDGTIHFTSAPANKTQIILNSPPLISLNNWYHIAGVIDSKNKVMTLFINGNEVANTEFGSEIRVSHLPLLIGWTQEENTVFTPGYSSFAGKIDEVRIRNTALTQKDIQANMNVKLTGQEPSLVGYWQFDKEGAEGISDTSANKIQGKLVGNAKIVKCDRPILGQTSPDKLAKSAEAYEKALLVPQSNGRTDKFEPNSYETYRLLIKTYLQINKRFDAERVYRQALNSDSRQIEREPSLKELWEPLQKTWELNTVPNQENLVNKIATSFTLSDIKGKKVKLSDFKGKVVLLNFLATWCSSSLKEIPYFISLYDQYKKQGFEMISICVDKEGIKGIKSFAEQYKINYPILISDQSVLKLYGSISYIPTTFLIDREGKIRSQYIGYRDKSIFESDIKSLISGEPVKMKVDIAMYTEKTNWIPILTADKIAEDIKKAVGDRVKSINIVSEKELPNWIKQNTGDGETDIIVLFGDFPDSIYSSGNNQPDGSSAELFLEDGNMFLNTADHIFWGGELGLNGSFGLMNMLDSPNLSININQLEIIMNVTPLGKQFLPSLERFGSTRSIPTNRMSDEWEVEASFADDGGANADPVVIRNKEDGGRIAIFYQVVSNDEFPRAAVIREFILNWLPTVAGIPIYPSEHKESLKDALSSGSISGIVLDAESKTPVTKAKIEIAKDGFHSGLFGWTDNNGKYTINGVPVGNFDVIASRFPYTKTTINTNMKPDETASKADFEMKPIHNQ